MSLQEYTKKRNFEQTPEPQGKSKSGLSNLAFVVQRHKATQLHYDFRLEVDGVLKSWAVPKGPSMNPGDKRMAIMVEDHPYSYKDFEGTIPEGNYGAGIVEIWDSGWYSDIENNDPENAQKNIEQGLQDGSIKFTLHGKKLNGEFTLVKIHNPTFNKNAWLLIKHKDEYAIDVAYNSENYTDKDSPINQWLEKRKKRVALK